MVYFIQQGHEGLIKIGVARNPQKRRGALQIGSPQKLHLLGSIPGGKKREQEIHEPFASYHKRGEWYYPSLELLQCIEEHLKKEEGIGNAKLPEPQKIHVTPSHSIIDDTIEFWKKKLE